MVEQILERRTKQVDDEDVVKAFLAKIVYIWDTSWRKVSKSVGVKCRRGTDDSQPISYMFDIRPAIAARHSFEVPVRDQQISF